MREKSRVEVVQAAYEKIALEQDADVTAVKVGWIEGFLLRT